MLQLLSSLERWEACLSTPRQIAMQRMQHLGIKDESDDSHQARGSRDGLATLLVSLLNEASASWSTFLADVMHAGDQPSQTATICDSTELSTLQRTVRLISNVSQLDPALGEEVARSGSPPICAKLIERINRAFASLEGALSEEDSDALIELQDCIFEVYSPSMTGANAMAYTVQEMRDRLPLVYNLTPVASLLDGSGGMEENECIANLTTVGTSTTVFISQVTKRQTAQVDVGFVMWPSAIFLTRWLISNPRIISNGRSVLELGGGCGLVGIAAARIMSHQTKGSAVAAAEGGEVVITDINELVLDNILHNIKLNDVASIATVAKLDFYEQTGVRHSGGWIGSDSGSSEQVQREPVDVVLAADIICQPEDAIASSKTIYDALKPNGGVAYVVCATAEHRYGVDIFGSECEKRGLVVSTRNAADMYNEEDRVMMETAAGYVDGMKLIFFEIAKR